MDDPAPELPAALDAAWEDPPTLADAAPLADADADELPCAPLECDAELPVAADDPAAEELPPPVLLLALEELLLVLPAQAPLSNKLAVSNVRRRDVIKGSIIMGQPHPWVILGGIIGCRSPDHCAVTTCRVDAPWPGHPAYRWREAAHRCS